MTVYVDDSRNAYGRMVMCHMLADTDGELRAMAMRIGVRERWHQGDHFDVCMRMRERAVKAGAVEITGRQAAAMRRRLQVEKRLGLPEDALAWLAEYRKHWRRVHFDNPMDAAT